MTETMANYAPIAILDEGYEITNTGKGIHAIGARMIHPGDTCIIDQKEYDSLSPNFLEREDVSVKVICGDAELPESSFKEELDKAITTDISNLDKAFAESIDIKDPIENTIEGNTFDGIKTFDPVEIDEEGNEDGQHTGLETDNYDTGASYYNDEADNSSTDAQEAVEPFVSKDIEEVKDEVIATPLKKTRKKKTKE